jgi:hypothetical protein
VIYRTHHHVNLVHVAEPFSYWARQFSVQVFRAAAWSRPVARRLAVVARRLGFLLCDMSHDLHHGSRSIQSSISHDSLQDMQKHAGHDSLQTCTIISVKHTGLEAVHTCLFNAVSCLPFMLRNRVKTTVPAVWCLPV